MNPRILILDHPTRGSDVGAKAEIYRQMATLVAHRITMLIVASEVTQ
jgi:ABC-type sugar transport system ATPase subunit